MEKINITLAQINPIVGNLEYNFNKISNAYAKAKAQVSDLVVFSECVVTGYPVEDLALKPSFVSDNLSYLTKLAQLTVDGPAMLVGYIDSNIFNGQRYNAVALLNGGKVKDVRYKTELPNYGVFDEHRIFTPSKETKPIFFKGFKLGVMICEDMWYPTVSKQHSYQYADILICINGSPFEANKVDVREQEALKRVSETGLPLIYVNQVGGQDELVFDGGSFVIQPEADSVKKPIQFPYFVERVNTCLFERTRNGVRTNQTWTERVYSEDERIYQALVLGLRDYVNKNKFPGVILGISGGIDSALAATIAVDALGPSRVRGFKLSSEYTSETSITLADQLAKNLGIEIQEFMINPVTQGLQNSLITKGLVVTGVAAENAQSRARGMILMAISNTTGEMVLSTGNKSEVSVGFATLYGDMVGGFNPLKDLYKYRVVSLCTWRNRNYELIPNEIIQRPPTPELAPNQLDEDKLPPYPILDAILENLIEKEKSIAEIAKLGYEEPTVKKVYNMVMTAEYKRRQACPGIKITSKVHGKDRRYPITQGYRP